MSSGSCSRPSSKLSLDRVWKAQEDVKGTSFTLSPSTETTVKISLLTIDEQLKLWSKHDAI
jgi:hypothetical protein